MERITIDASLPVKLPTLKAAVELCDPSGTVLGKFIPRVDMSEWEPITPTISAEELDRRARSDKWCSFDEVMAKLKDPETA